MSTFVPVEIQCRSCDRAFTVELLEGIHATRLPDVRRDILEGRFQRFACPHCSTDVSVENDTIYTDFDRKHYVAVRADVRADWQNEKAEQALVFRENFDEGPEIARELGSEFVHRLVADIAALREKLLVWDAGLDDRVVEAVKGARQSELDIEVGAELWRVAEVLDGGHLMFVRFRPVDGAGFRVVEHETVSHDAYARWASGDDLDWEFSLLLDDWVVDHFIQYTAAARPGPLETAPGPAGRPTRAPDNVE